MVTPKIHPTSRQTIYTSQFARNFLVSTCEALYLKKSPDRYPKIVFPRAMT